MKEYKTWAGHTLVVDRLGDEKDDYIPQGWIVTHPEYCSGTGYCAEGSIIARSGMDLLIDDEETDLKENVEYELGILILEYDAESVDTYLIWRSKDANRKDV